jgi:hypothetical protein
MLLADKTVADVNPIVGSLVMVGTFCVYWFLTRKLKLFRIPLAAASAKTVNAFLFAEKAFFSVWLLFAFLGAIRGIFLLFE